MGGRLAQPFGKFLNQISQNEERFLYKPACKELGDKIFFCINRLKTLLKFEDQSEHIQTSVDDPLTKTFAIVQYHSQAYQIWLDYTLKFSV